MKTIKIGNLIMAGLNEKQEIIIRARDAFVTKYCAEKGWGDKEQLTIDQIMEIRRQDNWKNPVI